MALSHLSSAGSKPVSSIQKPYQPAAGCVCRLKCNDPTCCWWPHRHRFRLSYNRRMRRQNSGAIIYINLYNGTIIASLDTKSASCLRKLAELCEMHIKGAASSDSHGLTENVKDAVPSSWPDMWICMCM